MRLASEACDAADVCIGANISRSEQIVDIEHIAAIAQHFVLMLRKWLNIKLQIVQLAVTHLAQRFSYVLRVPWDWNCSV